MDHQMTEMPSVASSLATMATAAGMIPNNNLKVAAGYILQDRLGSGSFATVYKGVRHPDIPLPTTHDPNPLPPANIVAIKAISRASKKLTKKVLENLDMEIAILRTYRHPNIVCLHQVQKTERHFYLILEYCGGGDLQRLIRTRQKGRLSERLSRRLVRDLAEGLGFLWGKELVHRDIKPQNLLLTGPLPLEELGENPAREEDGKLKGRQNALGGSAGVDGEGFMLKIADFGFARHLAATNLAETMCGSPLYMAPEILQGLKYDSKADLWSVGTVLFEMIAGKPPFHGENHLDLLRNIQRKAVRLPPDVRVSKECVQLLRILLDRKPSTRADFKSFFEATKAFVALGCNGPQNPSPQSSSHSSSSNEMRPLRAQMDLCAIAENDGSGESYCEGHGAASLATVSTLGTVVNPQQLQQMQQALPPVGGPPHQPRSAQQAPTSGAQTSIPASNVVTSQNTALNAMVHARQDHMNRPGVVTPPFNPMPAPPPPALSTGLQGNYRHQRPSVFAPLQGSPNFSPSSTPMGASPPTLSLQDAPPTIGGGGIPLPRPGLAPMRQNQVEGSYPAMRQQHMGQQMVMNQNNTNAGSRDGSYHSTSCREAFDSGFVIVEHSGCRSRPGSGQPSPATSVVRANDNSMPPSPTHQQMYHDGGGQSPSSSGRVTILNARSGNVGLLSTSPGTGRALVGKMMGSPNGSMGVPAPPIATGGKFATSPRSALRAGGCLAHIESLARMLAAAEDIGRRAITVAHLGDVRAYMAMGLLVAQRDESQASSVSSCTPMEGVEEDNNAERDTPFASKSSKMNLWTRDSKKTIVEEEEDDEMPFAISTSVDGTEDMAHSPSSNFMANLAPIIGNNLSRENSTNSAAKEESTPTMIQMHFREALMCYLKTLSMMKGSIRAAQKVMTDVDEVINLPSAHQSPNSNNPYTPLKSRCATSMKWLSGQFSAVLERADAASEQISKIQKMQPSQSQTKEPSVCVEELIYNHSLKCGREGAVKQLLGHFDAARSCYRSAGLLAETLLMEPKVGEEDRAVLEGYVQSFADQITDLDNQIRIQMRSSRAPSANNSQTASASVARSGSTVQRPALTGE